MAGAVDHDVGYGAGHAADRGADHSAGHAVGPVAVHAAGLVAGHVAGGPGVGLRRDDRASSTILSLLDVPESNAAPV